VQGHAADAAALGHHRHDLGGAVEAEHAAVDHVAEIEAVQLVPHRPFDQAVAARNGLHGVFSLTRHPERSRRKGGEAEGPFWTILQPVATPKSGPSTSPRYARLRSG